MAVVLLAAVITPSIVGRTVVGQAEMALIPGPPAVGDCLLEPIRQAQQIDQVPTGKLTYRPLSIGPCTGARFGEVVSLIPAGQVRAAPATAPGVTNDAGFRDPNRARCRHDLDAYSGARDPSTAPGASQYWTSAAPISVTFAGPSPLQQSMGQDWIACVEFIDGVDGRSASYTSSLRNAIRQTILPPEAALCLATSDIQQEVPVPCSQEHQAEMFAYSLVQGISVRRMDAACLLFVRQLTGMTDPTATGRLRVYSTLPDTAGEAPYPPDRVCLVATLGTRSLTGPLIGIGNNPVPLSPS
ncbi:hypothetical protein ABIB25_003222 [Nakamurella sp. UYEF19]|uniref:hypothetical protein n=1 Tax=Nakamurella sp. UYEF19 TaxID=1756392 RepID=UPI00339B993E